MTDIYVRKTFVVRVSSFFRELLECIGRGGGVAAVQKGCSFIWLGMRTETIQSAEKWPKGNPIVQPLRGERCYSSKESSLQDMGSNLS